MTNDAPAQASVEADIVYRLRAAIELGDRTGSRGRRPENIYNVADAALAEIVRLRAFSPLPTVGAEDEAVAWRYEFEEARGRWVVRYSKDKPHHIEGFTRNIEALYTRPSPSVPKTENGPPSEEKRAIAEITVQLQPAEGDGRAEPNPSTSSAVEVKGLEWFESRAVLPEQHANAQSVVGGYKAITFMTVGRAPHLVSYWHGPEGRDIRVGSFDEAKAAAQADYEQRVRSCIASEKSEGLS